jgi:hypothetical protein
VPTYSLVVPAYNEEGVIEELAAHLLAVMDALDGDAEAILVSSIAPRSYSTRTQHRIGSKGLYESPLADRRKPKPLQGPIGRFKRSPSTASPPGSQANEQTLAPTTALIALVALNQICRASPCGAAGRPQTRWASSNTARSRTGR